MQPQITENSPSYIGWRYPTDGSIRITVEGVGEHIDGDTLFTYSPLIGVEAGPSEVVAPNGRADLIVFKGKYADQRRCFEAWVLLARENARPAIFLSDGMVALAKLDLSPMPPLPETDEFATKLANDVLGVSRKLMLEVAETEDLTLEDCRVIVATVGDAMTNDVA